MSDFIIGDIHGCPKTTKKLIEDKISPGKDDRIVFVGDYIDRGSNSKGVVDYIIELKDRSNAEIITLRGNHEQMLLNAISNNAEFDLWLINHGDTTLRDYGIDTHGKTPKQILNELPEAHLEFYRNTRLYFQAEGYIAVHAGFNFDRDDFKSDEFAMVWTREWNPDMDRTKGRPVIHGHTPTPLAVIKKMIAEERNAINVDNGCKFKKLTGYGNLVAYCPQRNELLVQPNID